jgi:hypothetical protein
LLTRLARATLLMQRMCSSSFLPWPPLPPQPRAPPRSSTPAPSRSGPNSEKVSDGPNSEGQKLHHLLLAAGGMAWLITMPVYAWNRDHHHFASPMFGAKTSAMMALRSLYSSRDAKRTCAACCNWDASARVRMSAGMHGPLFSHSGISLHLVLCLEKFVGKLVGEGESHPVVPLKFPFLGHAGCLSIGQGHT